MKFQFFIGLLILFVYEHISRINNWYPISSHLVQLSKILENAWYQIGQTFSKLSSFLDYLHLEEVQKTLVSLIEPMVAIFFSWTHGIAGYIDSIFLSAHPQLIGFGSLLLLIVIDALIGLCRQNGSLVQRINRKLKSLLI